MADDPIHYVSSGEDTDADLSGADDGPVVVGVPVDAEVDADALAAEVRERGAEEVEVVRIDADRSAVTVRDDPDLGTVSRNMAPPAGDPAALSAFAQFAEQFLKALTAVVVITDAAQLARRSKGTLAALREGDAGLRDLLGGTGEEKLGSASPGFLPLDPDRAEAAAGSILAVDHDRTDEGADITEDGFDDWPAVEADLDGEAVRAWLPADARRYLVAACREFAAGNADAVDTLVVDAADAIADRVREVAATRREDFDGAAPPTEWSAYGWPLERLADWYRRLETIVESNRSMVARAREEAPEDIERIERHSAVAALYNVRAFAVGAYLYDVEGDIEPDRTRDIL